MQQKFGAACCGLARAGRLVGAAFAVAAAVVSHAYAQDSAPFPRLTLEDDGLGSAERALAAAPSALPVAVRAVLRSPTDASDVEARLSSTGMRPLWLVVTAPSREADVEGWRQAIRSILPRLDGPPGLLEVAVDRQLPSLAAFAVQVAATEAHAADPRLRVGVGGPAMAEPAVRSSIYTAALAPYVDVLVVPRARQSEAATWLEQLDQGAELALTEPEGDEAVAGHALAGGLLQDLGAAVVSHAWPAVAIAPAALASLSPLAPLFEARFSELAASASDLSITSGGRPAPPSDYRLLFDTRTFATYLAYWGTPPGDTLTIALRLAAEGSPVVTNLRTGARMAPQSHDRDAATNRTSLVAPAAAAPLIIDFNDGVAIGEESVVAAERPLTVEEIIARHQRQQLVQDRLVASYIADARVRQFFRPTLADPGYEVVTENRYFVAGDGIEWEQLSFAVNGSKWRDDPPPYPLLQPERVLSLPLQLRLDEGYTYRLQGTERIDGFDCYVVRFEPVRADPSLYGGTVWIDRRTFARVRVHAVQGGLPGMVVSNDETHRYAPVADVEGQPIFLFVGLTGRQTMLISGRNILLERTVEFSGFRVNSGDFAEHRASARESDRTMFRETENGLRYYVKEGGRRVISDRPTSSVKAMALGTVIDPSYAFPLPIFGINYIDFSFGSANQQLALLFGGVLAAGNIQRPQLGSRHLSGSLDFFAIAAPSSDRVYEADGEREAARVLTWPMSTGVNLGWQATPFQKLTLQYQLRFDAYVRDTTTSESFRLPSSTITNGIGLNWEYSRAGYSVVLNGAWHRRGAWRAWGIDEGSGPAEASAPTYSKFMASVSRDFLLDAFQKVGMNGAWFSGRSLDRFVKYQFGLFDATRLHGVPAAARFGELAMARGSYSLNIFEQYRVDLFLEHAWGRDDHHDPDWQPIPAVGAAFNLRAPWNTILRADVGRSWLPDRYRTLGSTSLQIMLLKPLR
jgi:hypothetical protein